ncbi:hypothetical protein SNEBB_008625 [Seison nebaliae]|nr:hypothetical protein SNEBB_008625 [Seison nebaliae]
MDNFYLINRMEENKISLNPTINFEHDRFPYCIVWTPIPFISWLFPIIGHTGISFTNGIITDFAGPYVVSEDNMAFGRPLKYVQLDVNRVQSHRLDKSLEERISYYDSAVTEAASIYRRRVHNICCDNCHSHCAHALDLMEYDGKSSWTMFHIALMLLLHGKYRNKKSIIKTWLPFILIVGLIIIIVVVTRMRKVI